MTYGVFEVNRICEILKLGDCVNLVRDWGKLTVSIIKSDNFCKFHNSQTETYQFWSHFLNEKGIEWTSKTRRLIQIILVTPIGSAEAERGFSIMNHIKTKRRTRITPGHSQDNEFD